MKRSIVALIALMFSGLASAYYPDQLSTDGLPEAIPCSYHKTVKGNQAIRCHWQEVFQTIYFKEDDGSSVAVKDTFEARCHEGVCRTQDMITVGHWSEDLLITMPLWYYLDSSIDGKPVAYLAGTGPSFGGGAMTYSQAANKLHEFYKWIYPNRATADRLVAARLITGDQLVTKKNGQVKVQQEYFPEVKEAWCNPRMDDECFINNRQIPMDDLREYLPQVDQKAVEALGGVCDRPICYDEDNKPIGIRPF